jgi:hypothetical protein
MAALPPNDKEVFPAESFIDRRVSWKNPAAGKVAGGLFDLDLQKPERLTIEP